MNATSIIAAVAALAIPAATPVLAGDRMAAATFDVAVVAADGQTSASGREGHGAISPPPAPAPAPGGAFPPRSLRDRSVAPTDRTGSQRDGGMMAEGCPTIGRDGVPGMGEVAGVHARPRAEREPAATVVINIYAGGGTPVVEHGKGGEHGTQGDRADMEAGHGHRLPGVGAAGTPLSPGDVRAGMERHLAEMGGDGLAVGSVAPIDDDLIAVEIRTRTGARHHRMIVSRRNGSMMRAD